MRAPKFGRFCPKTHFFSQFFKIFKFLEIVPFLHYIFPHFFLKKSFKWADIYYYTRWSIIIHVGSRFKSEGTYKMRSVCGVRVIFWNFLVIWPFLHYRENCSKDFFQTWLEVGAQNVRKHSMAAFLIFAPVFAKNPNLCYNYVQNASNGLKFWDEW